MKRVSGGSRRVIRIVEETAMKKNDWAERFGSKRRATDRKLLADLERQIAAEEETRERIARAFGRPLDSVKH